MHNVHKWVEILPEAVRIGNKPVEEESIELTGDGGEAPPLMVPDDWERDLNKQKEVILRETQRVKERILEQARQEAESLLKTAQEESEAIREQARQEGQAHGIQSGKAQVASEWERKITVLEQWFQEIRNSRDQLLETVKEPLVELSVHIAEKIIQRESEQRPFVMETVELALEKLSHRERVVVRVNPMEYVLVRELKDDLLARVDGIDTLEIREDQRIEAGGCLVETVFGSVDARVNDQLDIIREVLMETLRNT